MMEYGLGHFKMVRSSLEWKVERMCLCLQWICECTHRTCCIVGCKSVHRQESPTFARLCSSRMDKGWWENHQTGEEFGCINYYDRRSAAGYSRCNGTVGRVPHGIHWLWGICPEQNDYRVRRLGWVDKAGQVCKGMYLFCEIKNGKNWRNIVGWSTILTAKIRIWYLRLDHSKRFVNGRYPLLILRAVARVTLNWLSIVRSRPDIDALPMTIVANDPTVLERPRLFRLGDIAVLEFR